eukprot:s515_g16.t1
MTWMTKLDEKEEVSWYAWQVSLQEVRRNKFILQFVIGNCRFLAALCTLGLVVSVHPFQTLNVVSACLIYLPCLSHLVVCLLLSIGFSCKASGRVPYILVATLAAVLTLLEIAVSAHLLTPAVIFHKYICLRWMLEAADGIAAHPAVKALLPFVHDACRLWAFSWRFLRDMALGVPLALLFCAMTCIPCLNDLHTLFLFHTRRPKEEGLVVEDADENESSTRLVDPDPIHGRIAPLPPSPPWCYVATGAAENVPRDAPVQDDDIYLPSLHEEALRTALKDFDVKTRLALRRILRLKAGLTNSQAAAGGAGPGSVATPKAAKKAPPQAVSGTAAVQPNQQGESAVKSEVRKVRVPEDAVVDRVNGLLAKGTQDKLTTSGDPSDPSTWKTVKDVASAVQFRLITPAELKAHQQKMRKQKPNPAKDEKKSKAFVPEAHAIQVDPSHFVAEGKPVQMLEIGRFGPDQTGLCIVSPAEAKRSMQDGVRSCDALAMLVIGDGTQQLGAPFSLPAHLSNGSPVIVHACLIQFGDIPIEFKLQLPTAEVTMMESTVIEFGIYKQFVGNWQDTAIPLHYMGVHVPALRGNNLLAVWSVKAWNDKKVVHHNQATHWHGYFRVSDMLLNQVLARSGSAGVFMNPKTADRRHDPRYTTIPLPGKKLSEVTAKAEGCVNAKGIAKLGDTFAIRCCREHAAGIRANLMPESACVETASFTQDQILFVAKNVPQVGRDELTEALQKTGWEATAVKPQGMSRWILAAKSEPQNSHVIVNGAIMTVERMHKSGEHVPVTFVAREVRVNTTTDPQGVVSTTSRFAEFKAQFEAQISQAVDTKLQMAHSKIEQLTQALQDVQNKTDQVQTTFASEMGQMKEEQAFTQKKLQEVETSVASNSQQIITQMQNMFSQMQSNMEQTMMSLVNDPEKRQRTEPPKNDPFGPKA